MCPARGDAAMRAKQRAIPVGCPLASSFHSRRAHTEVTRPDWTAGHSHNDALRKVSKEVLKDLWRAARDLHEEKGLTP